VSSLTEDSSASSSLKGFTVEGPIFTQPSESPCSKGDTWRMSVFSMGFQQLSPDRSMLETLHFYATQGSCDADYFFPPLSGGVGTLSL
jgi:hypothetical protein